MAISISKFKFSQIVADGSVLPPRHQPQPLISTNFLQKMPQNQLHVSFKTQSILEKTKEFSSLTSMSTLLTELEREQERSEKTGLEGFLLESEVEECGERDERLRSRNRNDKKKPPLPLSQRWREIAGESNWAGLLDPIDPLLRAELIKYGEMSQSCYDAFDYDLFSKYCGSCKYIRRKFFESLGMSNLGYDVTRYLYATSNIRLPNFIKQSRWPNMWSEAANWIGYIAVSNDDTSAKLGRRDIAIAWRGTVTRLEWLADLSDFLKRIDLEGIPCPDPSVKVESGFVDLYTDKDPNCRFCKYSAREQVLAETRKLVKHYTSRGETVSISITGHSLGSALAMLSAFDLAESGLNRGVDGNPVSTTVYSFSGPRVGNQRFKERFEDALGIKAFRVVNVHDTVPKVPGVFFNERVAPILRSLAEKLLPWWCYTHVGVELELDHKMSPFLKETNDLSCYHNLEAHLHLLDGYHGRDKRFSLTSGRDPALVNKACDFLRDHHLVPPYWRQDENKGMVMKDGKWVQPERPRMDDHPEDTHHHLSKLEFLQQNVDSWVQRVY